MRTLLRAMLLLCVMAIAATPAAAAQPNWPGSLTLATASLGGTYHAYGVGLAKILTQALGLPVSERTTEGPSQNIQLIESNEAQIAFVTMGAALQGWNGTGDWTNGKSYRAMRAAFPMYDTPFHFIVLKNSPITSLAGMADKRIGVGPHGGTSGTYVPRMLAALNISATLVEGSWDDMAAQLKDGTVDVLAAAVGAPFPAIAGLEKTKNIRYVPVDEEQVVVLRLAIPELTLATIPAGTYPSLMKAYPTVGLYNFAVVHKDLPSDLVFQIVEAVFAYHDKLVEAHPAAAATVPENFIHNTFLPYHSGASRYYSINMVTGVVRGD